MQKFQTITSTCVPLPIENIDTDQIIPARFLKATSKEGFGENLFRDWRYHATNQVNENFVLNQPIYSGKILVVGDNFGCGSSREHAAWALYDYGFRVIISSSFADIFKNNALNNFLLPIQLENKIIIKILNDCLQDPKLSLTIDLERQTVQRNDTKEKWSFEIDAHKKNCLLQGFDDLDFLLSLKDKRDSYLKNIPNWRKLDRNKASVSATL